MSAYAATPYNSAIPGVADYGTAENGAVKAYGDALANINLSRQSLLRQNGYLGDVDPTSGTITNLRVDPYNPYGQLQQLYNREGNEDINAADQAQQRGLFGGLAHQPEQQLRYQHGVERTDFGTALQSAMQGYDAQQGGAASTRDNALWQAQLQADMLAMANGDYNPANYDTTTGSDGSGAGSDGSGSGTAPGGRTRSGLMVSDVMNSNRPKAAPMVTSKALTPAQKKTVLKALSGGSAGRKAMV